MVAYMGAGKKTSMAIELKAAAAMTLVISVITWMAAGIATMAFRYLGQAWMDAFTNGATVVVVLLVVSSFLLGGDVAMRVTVPAANLFKLDRRFDADSQRERIRDQAGVGVLLWGGVLAAAQLILVVFAVNS